jgi:hypothetical protein
VALKPRDRIKLIRDIVAALHANDESDVNLVLSQHGFPTTDMWSGDMKSYVQGMIERGDDDDLRELHSFLYSESDVPPAELSDAAKQHGIWKPQFFEGDRFFQLFISHTHHHKAEVASLKAALIPYGVSAFVAHQDINPTSEWEDVIEVGLRTCDGLLAYLTEHFHESVWTDHEVGVALGRNVLVVPLNMGVNPYGLIGKYQAVPGIGRTPEALASDVVNSLRSNGRTRQLMAEVAVDRFCFSYSYNNARSNLDLIRQIPRARWTQPMVAKVRSAVSANNELTADVGFGQSTVAAEALKIIERL